MGNQHIGMLMREKIAILFDSTEKVECLIKMERTSAWWRIWPVMLFNLLFLLK